MAPRNRKISVSYNWIDKNSTTCSLPHRASAASHHTRSAAGDPVKRECTTCGFGRWGTKGGYGGWERDRRHISSVDMFMMLILPIHLWYAILVISSHNRIILANNSVWVNVQLERSSQYMHRLQTPHTVLAILNYSTPVRMAVDLYKLNLHHNHVYCSIPKRIYILWLIERKKSI